MCRRFLLFCFRKTKYCVSAGILHKILTGHFLHGIVGAVAGGPPPRGARQWRVPVVFQRSPPAPPPPPFEIGKISAAITKAFEALEKQYHPSVIDMLALRVTADFEPKIRDSRIAVEDIQDSVEKVLSEAGYADVAKAYILYRKQREKVRNVNSTLLNYRELVDNYLQINDWRVKENSTVTYSVGGLILSNSGAITANYWLSEIYDQEVANAHRNAEIHIHDLSMLTARAGP